MYSHECNMYDNINICITHIISSNRIEYYYCATYAKFFLHCSYLYTYRYLHTRTFKTHALHSTHMEEYVHCWLRSCTKNIYCVYYISANTYVCAKQCNKAQTEVGCRKFIIINGFFPSYSTYMYFCHIESARI